MKPNYYLFLSNKPSSKLVILMPAFSHIHRFGGIKKDGTPYRDFTLLNNKSSIHYEPDKDKRNQIKSAYHKRHGKEKGGQHSRSSMSKIILWSAPTLLGGIKNYESRYNVNVIFKNTTLTPELTNKLMNKNI